MIVDTDNACCRRVWFVPALVGSWLDIGRLGYQHDIDMD